MRKHLIDPELFELVKTYQVDAHCRTCWKYNKNECRFCYGWSFTEKTIITKALDSKFSNDEKQEVFTWINTLLRQVKSCIDNHLNPAKVSAIDPTKNNFTQPPGLKEILDELQIFNDNHYTVSSISNNSELEVSLTREPNCCFLNNYFDVGLKAWKANIDIQPVFDEYKAVTYLCHYFSKTEDRCSQVMKQAAKEAF